MDLLWELRSRSTVTLLLLLLLLRLPLLLLLLLLLLLFLAYHASRPPQAALLLSKLQTARIGSDGGRKVVFVTHRLVSVLFGV